MGSRKAAAQGSALLQKSTISTSTIDASAPPPPATTIGSAKARKGVTTRLTYFPVSPRLQALASPIGPCTPFTLEDVGLQSITGGGGDYISTPVSQEHLDKAFARTRQSSVSGAKRLYSSVLTAQR